MQETNLLEEDIESTENDYSNDRKVSSFSRQLSELLDEKKSSCLSK